MRGTLSAVLLLLCSCSPKNDGSLPTTSGGAPIKIEKLTLVPPMDRSLRADTAATFRLEAVPPLPADATSEWEFQSSKDRFTRPVVGPSVDVTFSAGGLYRVQAKIGSVASNVVEIPVIRVTLADGDEKPLREGRAAIVTRDGLRPEAIAASADRVRILVEDPLPDPPSTVTFGGRTMALTGTGERRSTKPFLLLSDPEDAAAAGELAMRVAPGSRVDLAYRGAPAGSVKIGPAVLHEIPVRFVVVGPGMPPTAELERAAELRLAQANAVWEPFGRRFVRAALVRLEAPRGLVLIRGRAAGADGQGRPSRCGMVLDGREVSVPAVWRNDGAPMTPKATARALIAKAGSSFQIDLFEGLFAGDRESVVLRVRRSDGTAADAGRIADGHDVAQAVEPLPLPGPDGVEVAPSASLLSLEEIALLASGKGLPFQGFDLFVVPGLRSLQTRPTFKVYPDSLFPPALAGSAIVSWSILDGSGKFPYGLARVAGQLLLPPGWTPAPEDTLFAEPLSESPGVDAHKRLTARTGLRIAERGRGLPAKK
jgi:hypothetical protein